MTDTTPQPHPVCPHCGHDDHDEWEWDFVGGEHVGHCASCGEEFKTERFVTAYYTTSKGPAA